MSADRNQGECTIFLKQYGFFPFKPPDLMYNNEKGEVAKKGTKVWPMDAGRLDTVFTGSYHSGGWMEVKYGEDTRFPFSKVRQSQRDWYHRVGKPLDISCWIFFCVGEALRENWRDIWEDILIGRRKRNAKDERKLPRVTFLMPFGSYLNAVEKQYEEQGEKSVSYSDLINFYGHCILPYSGGKLCLPDNHNFRAFFRESIDFYAETRSLNLDISDTD